MTDKEINVDPNSGAAPQPGGYAGQHAASKGFAGAHENLEEETAPAFYEPPGGNPAPKSVGELAELAEGRKSESAEADPYRDQLRESLSNPKKVLADLDESGEKKAPEPGKEAKAADAASLEKQGIDPSGETQEDSDTGSEESGAFDPSEHTVPEVQEYLEKNPDQRDAVVAAEKAGQARKGIVGED